MLTRSHVEKFRSEYHEDYTLTLSDFDKLCDQAIAAIALKEALQRCLNWLSSYPGAGTMGKDGPYEQARKALAALEAK